MCKVVSKEFEAAVMRNRGLFKDYAELVPKAAQHFLRKVHDIPNSTGVEVSIFEPKKVESHLEGTFFVGVIVNGKAESLPEGMEYIRAKNSYAMVRGRLTEIEQLYTKLDKWIGEQDDQYRLPEAYIIEVYYPVENNEEDVEVYIPIKI
ncbi:GyrI-like domain-containing protein [Bacillus sp. ISL-47]|uniref:GyrI-like domain-containing protein n=1 Tax=Bacillus sp. ISL-47 TaxID=2819130 RepID=UPI001BEC440A|nr:GyrI-like domain-containing protein [Bacillus sp. ISL-47]MBT2691195.1 GyrI-like domain-containing protein [Bacillus sp. ISL-47]